MPVIKVYIADDHKIIRDGLISLLSTEVGIEVVGEADNGRTAEKQVRKLKPDVVIMDIDMPKLNGIDATRLIVKERPDTKVLGLSVHSEEYCISAMLKAGVSGYLTKESSFEEVTKAIRSVYNGENFLSGSITSIVLRDHIENLKNREEVEVQEASNREREVIQLVAQGKSSKDIAVALSISVNTVIRHRHNIMEKFGLKNTADMTRYAVRERLISL